MKLSLLKVLHIFYRPNATRLHAIVRPHADAQGS